MDNKHYGNPFLKHLQVIFFITLVLYFGRGLLVPLCYSLLIAIVLYPACQWLEHHRWPRSLAVALCLLSVILLFGALVSLLGIQINVFRKDLPELINKLKPSLVQLQLWIESRLHIPVSSQNEWWQQTIRNIGSNAGSIAQNAIAATADTLFSLFLVPVFSALFLYNRGVFVKFLGSITGSRYKQQLGIVLGEVIHTYYSFIIGMIKVYLIVGILNSIGLLALGIPHAILFGMLTAIMTIIPYIGIIISALLPISVAWLTKDSVWYPIGVIAVFTFVQYLEGNVIFPKVVATQLKVSTWATLVAIIAGGIIWGVSGMILFIPLIGILKIVVTYVPEWSFINILLGRDEIKKPG